jgi:alkanesulfonate monooxygenase SsuD/methylene tetrahydromethanopterin reductase-like flavin-dependent oxidoreductase (luciferase family)
MVGKLAIAGTPGDCAAQLGRLLDTGIQHPLLAPIAVEPDGIVALFERVLAEVLPAVRRP